MHLSLLLGLGLCLLLGYGSARYVDPAAPDYDPNVLRPELFEPAEVPEEIAVTEEIIPDVEVTPPEAPEEEDSCQDFPPTSCIRHFSPLPRNLQRSPFALRSESDFLVICEAYKKALQCLSGFASRCHPQQTEARIFIEQMSSLLDQCDTPQIRQDVLIALECGRRMGAVHERCIRETRFIPQLKNLSSERMIKGDEHSIRDLCCGMRYHKACFMDQVPERCGQAAFEANQRLESVIMSGFNCEAISSSDCPAIRLY